MKILNRLEIIAVFISSLFVSCNGKTEILNNQENLKYNAIQRIKCNADTSQTYGLYLPSNYNSNISFPVIFLFDPHGSGNFALEIFKEAAERYGYIIVASNNSKNGVGDLVYILEVLTRDVFQKYSIDKKRIYTAGFSGGGRVALSLAKESGYVKGVLTAGAGISRLDITQLKNKFDIYAIAGYGDFNYSEVAAISAQLNGTGWRYVISTFDGGHTWPPTSIINEAVQWFSLNAMREGLLQEDKIFIKEISEKYKYECDSLIKAGQYLDAEITCTKAISFLNAISSVKRFRKLLQKIKDTPEYKQESLQQEQYLQLESGLQSGYLNYLATPDTVWWKRELDNLNNSILNEQNHFARQMYMRMKGFLGIVLYTYINKAFSENNLTEIPKFIVVYKKLEPKNPDMFFFTAIMYDRNNEEPMAIAYLEKSIEMGFNDMSKLENLASKKLRDYFMGKL
jgi:poly(3-hydroxybutyrate) depolymerase